jgi:hypothetical protein
MDELQRAAHKLSEEATHLERALSRDDPNMDLAVSVAKRARRQSTLLVKGLAAARDATQSED